MPGQACSISQRKNKISEWKPVKPAEVQAKDYRQDVVINEKQAALATMWHASTETKPMGFLNLGTMASGTWQCCVVGDNSKHIGFLAASPDSHHL